eukprot:14152048-Heterocapsa_arctica.AAC.1
MACRTTGLLLADQGELEPTLAITKKVMVNWLRQIEEDYLKTLLICGNNMQCTREAPVDRSTIF